jgi:hypothetical protein
VDKIVGEADIIDCFEMDENDLDFNEDMHQLDEEDMIRTREYRRVFAWVMSNVQAYDNPVGYQNKKGSVVWINI